MKKSLAAVLTATLLVLGCGGRSVVHNVYETEQFKDDSPYKRDFSDSAQEVCVSAQLALLSQGYRITSSEQGSVMAQKDFQPNAEVSAIINLKAVCRVQPSGSILFASALQTTYELKKNLQSTSLGISTLGSISLPLGSSSESLIKVGAETISDKDFYDRFFTLVESYLLQRESP